MPKPPGWHRKRPSASPEAGGYSAAHRAAREAAMAQLERDGSGPCCHCGGLIVPGMRLHLGHTDDRQSWRGLAHARCNVRAGASNGAWVANAHRNVAQLRC